MNGLSDMLRKVRAAVVRSGVAYQDADDVVNEAFLRLESYARKQEIRSSEAFLMTTARNIGRDQARHRARVNIHSEGLDIASLVDTAPRPEEQLEFSESLRRAASGLNQLNPQTRRCLLAKRLEGLSCAQIAERENLSIAAVEKRVTRALLLLTQWMGES